MTEPNVQQKATLWLAIVFVLGAALGGVLGYAFAHRSYASEPAHMSAEAKRAQRREQLVREVGMDANQQKQAIAILDESQNEYKAVHAVTDPQLEAVRQKTRDKIRALLTDDQKPKFESFLQRLDAERKRAEK
jgi:flagellar basal body-associated protein FliL